MLPFRISEDANTAALADLWLGKHGARPPPLLTIDPAGGDFTDTITIHLKAGVAEGQVHYTLDGTPPTAASPRSDAPLVLNEDAIVTAALIRGGKRIGPAQSARFHRLTEEELRGRSGSEQVAHLDRPGGQIAH